MAELFLHTEVRDMLERAVDGNATAWARANGMSQGYVSDVLNGRRDPGPRITRALGLEAITVYRSIAVQPSKDAR